MNRRIFLKMLAAAGVAPVIPEIHSLSSMYKKANAAIDYSSINISVDSVPSVLPQVINLFLYGGPSELAGNLSNIVDINQSSQVTYTDFFSGIATAQGDGIDGSITRDGFWGSNPNATIENSDNFLGAGGDDMQFLVDQNHMTVYRTMMKRKNTSQSHRENILMSQKGSLDIEFSPGIGNKLAAIISEHRALYQTKTKLAGGAAISNVEDLSMPFVSILDGDTRVFDKDENNPVPLFFNGISLDTNLSNPFSRNNPNAGVGGSGLDESAILEALAKQTTEASSKDYSAVVEAFALREELAVKMSDFEGQGFPLPQLPGDATTNPEVKANGGSKILEYPDTAVGRSLRAAVTLAVENPSTLFISLGGAFGGWDDHNNGVDLYPRRMRQVFEALRVAMMHIRYSDNTRSATGTPIRKTDLMRRTDNIIINVFGDFGRRVNLNSSLGWNHGNNQNFYTLGGSRPGIRTPVGSGTNGLGKVVGKTVRVGNAGEDRQFTEPDIAVGSYEFEPMSVAANIYKHFGVIAPAVIDANTPYPLTAYEDPDNPGGFIDFGSPPIDETQA